MNVRLGRRLFKAMWRRNKRLAAAIHYAWPWPFTRSVIAYERRLIRAAL